MKKLALCSAIALVSLNAAADVESRLYAGVNLYSGSGSEKVDRDDAGITDSTKEHIETSGGSLRAGYIFASNNRFEISATKIHADREEGKGPGAEFAGVDFDWKFTLNEEQVAPYVGVGFGLYNYKKLEKVTMDGNKINGLALNLAAGLAAQLNDNVEFDISVLFKGIGWEEIEFEDASTAKANETMTNLQIGVSYLF